MTRRLLTIIILSTAVFFALAAPSRRRSVMPPISLDMRRSFIVTDKPLLEGFTLDRVLEALIARSGVRGLTAAQLYRQWLDTQNRKPGLADPVGPHCDDFTTDGSPSFNDFPRRCPVPEGLLAAQPYAAGEYIPIALVNRFDLTTANGSNCGQYRMIFARITSRPGERLHMIFESVLPNPHPESGLAGCRPVAEFWAGLSWIDAPSQRRALLEQFYFDGIPGFAPAIHPDHYSVTGGGVRTSEQQSNGLGANRMYQFRTTKQCDGNDCTLRMTPDVLENLPFGRLFDSTVNLPKGKAFREAFVSQVQNLAIRDVNLYFMDIPRDFLVGESNSLEGEGTFAFDVPFTHGRSIPEGVEFRNRIQGELTRIGSTLTPEQIITRAETQNCVGCHFLGSGVGEGVVFPRSIDAIQQVTEDGPEAGEFGPNSRYRISSAMSDVFIPHRMKILTEFLRTGKAPERSQTIGGGRSIQ